MTALRRPRDTAEQRDSIAGVSCLAGNVQPQNDPAVYDTGILDGETSNTITKSTFQLFFSCNNNQLLSFRTSGSASRHHMAACDLGHKSS
jgi:hypothetical protein